MGTRYEQLVDERAAEKRAASEPRPFLIRKCRSREVPITLFWAASGWSWVGDRESPIAWGDGLALSLA
jgi:hypothetical protein